MMYEDDIGMSSAGERVAMAPHSPSTGTSLRGHPAFHITAVSGESILHTDWLYVQVSQSSMGPNAGILFRSCEGRRDYVGGINNFASLDLLHDPHMLARRIRLAGLASPQNSE
jgi:hypothetical protein